ncbi:glycosyltransferase family 4 protein [Parapedobacter indicus]|nr:glycosyltransferase family 4 protein [Parapedobacter indicus]
MKVAFYPEALNENPYLDLIRKALDGQNVEFIKVNQVFRDVKTFKSVTAVHFNWYENISERKRFKAFTEFLWKCSVLLALRISGKRIVWTMHNKQVHDSVFNGYNKLITWLFIRLSAVIVIHSKLSSQLLIDQYGKRITKKIHHIPHPHYINVYGKTVPELRKAEAMPLRLLFLGAVRPYKNIELLIDVIQNLGDNVSFTVAGKPLNVNYGKAITDRCTHLQTVELRLDFIEDEDIPQLMGSHDLLVLPYDINSSLNSGSVILAASYGRSVICPEIGTILDFEDQSCLLTYQYSDPNDHFDKLTQAILKAIVLKREQSDVFVEWGKALYDDVRRNHDEGLISARLHDVYSGKTQGAKVDDFVKLD